MAEKATLSPAVDPQDKTAEVLAEIDARGKAKVEAKTEVNKTEGKAEAKAELKADIKRPTIGEVLKGDKEKQTPRVVPEAPFLEIKNQNKEMRKELKELKDLIEAGGSKKDISESLKEIAEEHNVDPEFLTKLAKYIKAEAKSEMESEYSQKMKPLEEKERYTKFETIFKYHYDKTLEEMPEYEGIANEDVIKNLSALPINANKTFPQLLEESYGHLVKGKKTIDSGSATRAGGDEINDVDYDRANTDPEYFKQIMANPKLKKKYNAQMVKEIKI